MKDPRVAKCLEAKRESRATEFKEEFDPANAQQSLEFLKDIVAIANSGGGALAIGINNGGEGCKTDVKRVLNHDHAKYCDLIKKYTMQDFCDFEVIEAKKTATAWLSSSSILPTHRWFLKSLAHTQLKTTSRERRFLRGRFTSGTARRAKRAQLMI